MVQLGGVHGRDRASYEMDEKAGRSEECKTVQVGTKSQTTDYQVLYVQCTTVGLILVSNMRMKSLAGAWSRMAHGHSQPRRRARHTDANEILHY